MRKTIFFCSLLLAGFIGLISATRERTTPPSLRRSIDPGDVIGCAPGIDYLPVPDANGKFISLLPGRGNHHYSITTSSDSAQFYFDQGLSMYYSYHMREALASFREAARFDSNCAMAYWGQALAMGPTFNFYYLYKFNPAVPLALQKMNRLVATVPEKHRLLIQAMNLRYDVKDTTERKRKEMNTAYAAALKAAITQYSDDADIKAIYVDAVMLLHPWEFWNNDGSPKGWTSELVRYCRDILASNPQHPGGLHYYIHITEASRKPVVALSSADSLIRLFPGIAHMVHMSSHEYERIGYYEKGVKANEKADESLVLYDSLARGLFPQVHVPHYFAVDAYCAFSGAMYEKSIFKCRQLRNSVHPDAKAIYPQYQYMYLPLALVRMGRWEEILSDTATIPADWKFAWLISHFAKGMAYARTRDIASAHKELENLRGLMGDKLLLEKFAPHAGSPFEVASVAEYLLLGSILQAEKKYEGAIAALQAAIRTEDKILYAEPKLWLMPVRQYLGALLMDLKRYEKAAACYREDLAWNPGNGWSTLGLYQSLKALGKTGELAALKKTYSHSFSAAEHVPTRSAF